jgi:hypothetical protein
VYSLNRIVLPRGLVYHLVDAAELPLPQPPDVVELIQLHVAYVLRAQELHVLAD